MSQDRVYGHRRAGKPITDKEIEVLAAEAEAGYDVDTLLVRRAKRGRPTLESAPASPCRPFAVGAEIVDGWSVSRSRTLRLGSFAALA